jgi:hypothetical protein
VTASLADLAIQPGGHVGAELPGCPETSRDLLVAGWLPFALELLEGLLDGLEDRSFVHGRQVGLWWPRIGQGLLGCSNWRSVNLPLLAVQHQPVIGVAIAVPKVEGQLSIAEAAWAKTLLRVGELSPSVALGACLGQVGGDGGVLYVGQPGPPIPISADVSIAIPGLVARRLPVEGRVSSVVLVADGGLELRGHGGFEGNRGR